MLLCRSQLREIPDFPYKFAWIPFTAIATLYMMGHYIVLLNACDVYPLRVSNSGNALACAASSIWPYSIELKCPTYQGPRLTLQTLAHCTPQMLLMCI